MKKTVWFLLLASVLIVAGAGIAAAQTPRCMGGTGMGMMSGGMGMGADMPGMMGKCGKTMDCGMGAGCGCLKGKHMAGHHMDMGMMSGGMKMGMHHRFWHALQGLSLDANQKAAIGKVMTEAKKEMIRKKADLAIAMIELGDIVRADTVDMKAVDAKVKQVEGLKASMLIAGIASMEEMKSKLTPEQRKKLSGMMENPMACAMMSGGMSDEEMMGGGMMDEDMTEEEPAADSEGDMEEAPAGHEQMQH